MGLAPGQGSAGTARRGADQATELGSERIKRAQRLRKAADFQRVRARRQAWAHPLLVLHVAPNAGGPTRVGFVVGRRIGKAVVRNRVKRRLREAVRARYAALPAGFDLVWTARPPIAAADFAAIAAAVDQVLRRARLLPDGGTSPGAAPAAAPLTTAP